MLPSLIAALSRDWPKLTVTAKPKKGGMSPHATHQQSPFSKRRQEGFIHFFSYWNAAFAYFCLVYTEIARESSHGTALVTCTNTDKKQNPHPKRPRTQAHLWSGTWMYQDTSSASISSQSQFASAQCQVLAQGSGRDLGPHAFPSLCR